MGVHIINWRRHCVVWDSVSPTRRAGPNPGTPSPHLETPHRSVAVRSPDLMCNTETWGPPSQI